MTTLTTPQRANATSSWRPAASDASRLLHRVATTLTPPDGAFTKLDDGALSGAQNDARAAIAALDDVARADDLAGLGPFANMLAQAVDGGRRTAAAVQALTGTDLVAIGNERMAATMWAQSLDSVLDLATS